MDANKAAIMGLINNINEIITGDIASKPNERDQAISNRLKKRLENQNMLKILSYADQKTRNNLKRLWKELEKRNKRGKISKTNRCARLHHININLFRQNKE